MITKPTTNTTRHQAGETATKTNRAKAAAIMAGLMLLACAFPALSQAADARANRPGVAIMEIPVANGAYSGWSGFTSANETRMSDVLRDLFTTEFVDQGSSKIRLIERDRIAEILKEQNFGKSGDVDTSTIVAAGKLLGVKYMVTGKITRFATKKGAFSTGWGVSAVVSRVTKSRLAGDAAGSVDIRKASFTGRLDMRVIDVETGEIVAVASEEGTTANAQVKVAGTGGGIEYDDGMVNQVFEPIVKAMTPKLIKKILTQNQ